MIKNWRLFQLAVVIIIVVPVVLFSFWKSTYPERIKINNNVFSIEVADTPALMEKGLSGRKSISANEGMLFSFSAPGIHEFWMKDMKFSIDIVWFDSQRRVVHIEKSLSPSTFPKTFTSTVDSQYVLEILAGQSDKLGLKIGDQFNFVPKTERKLTF